MSLKSISLPKIAYLYIELCVLNHISTTPPILKKVLLGLPEIGQIWWREKTSGSQSSRDRYAERYDAG